MLQHRRGSTTIQQRSYWTGVVAVLACIFLILAGNTDFAWRLEHTQLPLSWIAGIVAIVAFLVAEYCGSAFPTSASDQHLHETPLLESEPRLVA